MVFLAHERYGDGAGAARSSWNVHRGGSEAKRLPEVLPWIAAQFGRESEREKNISALWRAIEHLATTTIALSAGPRKPGVKARHFDVLGFDLLLDRGGQPWLLEVN